MSNQHSHQLLKYYCSKCSIILKETDTYIDFRSFNSKAEECPHCGSLISETLRKEKERSTDEQQTNVKSNNRLSLSVSLLPKLQTAYDEFSSRLIFDIEKIDSVLKLTIRDIICIIGNEKYVNTFLKRLCVRALISKRQGGFDSPRVIFIDAGNNSDIYQFVDFALQYGLDIKKVLQSIITSRPFTVYQLANTIIYELPKIIHKFNETKVIVISNLTAMFVNDPQIQIKEAKCLIKDITNAIRKISSSFNILIAISTSPCHKTSVASSAYPYDKLIVPRFDKCMRIIKHIDTTKLQLDINVKTNNNYLNDDRILSLQENDLWLIPPR